MCFVESRAREPEASRADQIETFENDVFNFVREPKDRYDGRCIVWLGGKGRHYLHGCCGRREGCCAVEWFCGSAVRREARYVGPI